MRTVTARRSPTWRADGLPGGVLRRAGALLGLGELPDALQDEFVTHFGDRIPGLTWVTQDETSAISGFDPSSKYDKTGGTISGAVTATGAFVGQTSVSTPALTATNARFKGGPWFDVRGYGATGDGTTDEMAIVFIGVTADGERIGWRPQ